MRKYQFTISRRGARPTIQFLAFVDGVVSDCATYQQGAFMAYDFAGIRGKALTFERVKSLTGTACGTTRELEVLTDDMLHRYSRILAAVKAGRDVAELRYERSTGYTQKWDALPIDERCRLVVAYSDERERRTA